MKQTKERQKIIDKYIKRIKTDYPEDDKLMIDLQQFANEIISLPNDEEIKNIINKSAYPIITPIDVKYLKIGRKQGIEAIIKYINGNKNC